MPCTPISVSHAPTRRVHSGKMVCAQLSLHRFSHLLSHTWRPVGTTSTKPAVVNAILWTSSEAASCYSTPQSHRYVFICRRLALNVGLDEFAPLRDSSSSIYLAMCPPPQLVVSTTTYNLACPVVGGTALLFASSGTHVRSLYAPFAHYMRCSYQSAIFPRRSNPGSPSRTCTSGCLRSVYALSLHHSGRTMCKVSSTTFSSTLRIVYGRSSSPSHQTLSRLPKIFVHTPRPPTSTP